MINLKRGGRRILAAALAAMLAFAPTAHVFAEEETTEMDEREKQRQKCYAIAPDTNSLKNWPQGPSVYGDSAIVMDINSGAVLFGKQIEKKHYPASITKLLTTLVALDNAELTDTVEFSQDSISFLEYGDAHIGMTPGEQISMEDALYAVLLASANEVSYAVAESVGKKMGGDYNTFIQAMNDKSAEIGCTNSHWVNANGLHDEQHYTSAHDMARIGAAVYQHEEFRTISQSLSHTIGPTNLVNEDRVFQQKHKMLWPENDNYYEYCKGGKTGYTDQARTTLVTMADNGDIQLVAVVLYDFGNDAYVDTRSMFDYVYDNFSKVMLKDQEKPAEIEAYTDADNAYVVIPKGIEFSDLKANIEVIDEASRAGTVTYTYQGQDVGSTEVTLTEAALTKEDDTTDASADTSQKTVKKGATALGKIMIEVAVVIVVLLILLVIFVRIRRRQRQLMMRKRRRNGNHSNRRYESRNNRGRKSRRR